MHNTQLSTLFLSASLLFLSALSITGCNSASSAKPTEQGEASTNENDDDHGHDHSHGPAYKPDTFEQAISELGHKLEHMQEDLAEGHLDHVEQEVDNMKEFINWLPELSGDSDMEKAEWDQVKNTSKSMIQVCDTIKEELKNGKVNQERLKEFEKLLQQQDELVPHSIEKTVSPDRQAPPERQENETDRSRK